MSTIKNQIKSIALILSFLILFQGCTVYKSVPVSIETAVKNKSKVKVVTINNEKLKFNRIEFHDGKYFGIQKISNGMVRESLDENYIDTIKEKNKTLSTVLSIGIPVIIFSGSIWLRSVGCCGYY